jgi:FkbM family methyltransferase
MTRSLLARVRALPGRLLDAELRRQVRAAGLVAVHGHHLFAPGLDPGSVVIDAGAHTGQFSSAIVGRFGCLCLALEPVPELQARIAEGPRLRKFLLALGGTDGEVTLHLSDNPEANSVHPQVASELGHRGTLVARISTLSSFLREAEVERADLLKLDIEGAEIAVLETTTDETLRRLGQITVEFHDFLESFADHRPIEALKRRLRQNGFTCVVLSRPASNHSDTLFINRRRHRLALAQRFHLFLLRHVTLDLRRALHQARAWFP